MKNHETDRHVVAAGVKAGAQVITTSHLNDFAELPEGAEAQSPELIDDYVSSFSTPVTWETPLASTNHRTASELPPRTASRPPS